MVINKVEKEALRWLSLERIFKLRHIYTFEDKDDVPIYKDDIAYFHRELTDYEDYLTEHFELVNVPKAVFWVSEFVMKNVFEKSIPAFTREEGIYMCIDEAVWKNHLTEVIPDSAPDFVKDYYDEHIQDEMLTILGHELTHHSELFLNEFSDENPTCEDMWFEEGMAMFLPRYYYYDEAMFQEIYEVEKYLYEHYKNEYQTGPLEMFNYDIYGQSPVQDMFHYWRSFIVITDLVLGRYQGDVKLLFEDYYEWDRRGREFPLSEYLKAEEKEM